MKNVHRIMAVTLSTLLWFCSPIVSRAEETVSENDIMTVQETLEETENTVSENDVLNEENVVSQIVAQDTVMNVEISTVSEDMFSFILDPQGLILATNAIKYNGAEFEEGNLFFRNEEMRYSNTSNCIEIINKADTELEFTVTAVLNMEDTILLAEDNKFAEKEEECCIYMAIKDEDGETPILVKDGQKRLEITKIIPAAIDENGTRYCFSLTGACNTSDAWMSLSGDAPAVDITWSWKVIENEELETQTYATDLVETEDIDESKVVSQEEVQEISASVSGNQTDELSVEEDLDQEDTDQTDLEQEDLDQTKLDQTDELSVEEDSDQEDTDQTGLDQEEDVKEPQDVPSVMSISEDVPEQTNQTVSEQTVTDDNVNSMEESNIGEVVEESKI